MSQDTFDGDALAVSKYYERFKRFHGKEFHGSPMTLKGDMILVEKLPALEMKTKGGIIIAKAVTHRDTHADMMTEFGIVLLTGPGQVFEDGSTQACEAKPGDVILLPGNVGWYSQFGHMADYVPNTIGRLRDSQVGMTFTDYKKAFEFLNGGNL